MGDVKVVKGFTPYFHQKAVCDELKDAKGSGKIVVCSSSRQKGKSFMIANLLAYYAVNYAGTASFCLCPSLKQAKNIFRTLHQAFAKTGLIRSKNSTDCSITFINGSTINFKSAEQRENLRGFTCSGLLCIDECAFISDECLYTVLPWVDAYNAPMLLTSTPFIKQGFFWEYYNYGLERSHNCVTIDWAEPIFEESIRKILPQSKLEEYRKILPANVFRTEYLGLWLDDDGTVFVNLTKAMMDNHIKDTDRLYVGVDWSNQGEQDDTVISIFNQYGQQVLLRYFNGLTPLKQIDFIYNQLEPYLKQIVVIACETNSIGTPYTELIKKRSQLMAQKIKGFTTTNSSKNDIVTEMQVALEQEKVKLLPDDKQKRQFGYFTATYNPQTRNVSYAAPNGLHDDCVMATLIAYDSLGTAQEVGHYSIGFKGKRYGRNKH